MSMHVFKTRLMMEYVISFEIMAKSKYTRKSTPIHRHTKSTSCLV